MPMPVISNKKYDRKPIRKTTLDGNKIFDVSELFRCYFDFSYFLHEKTAVYVSNEIVFKSTCTYSMFRAN